MSKRANGEGSIYQTEKGYRAQITVNGTRSAKRFAERHDAVNWLNNQLSDANKGTYIEPSKLQLVDWVIEYIETYCLPTVRQRTYESYLSLAKHIAPIGEVQLQKLTGHQVQRLINQKAKTLSAETCNKILKLLKAALNKAVDNNLIPRNVANTAIAPKSQPKERKIFTTEEIALLLEKSQGQRMRIAIVLAATTGMRLSEVLGLRWTDVDFNSGTLSISQTLQETQGGKIIFEPPKSKNSRRKISLPYQTLDALRKERISRGFASELVVTSSTGTPERPNNFERWFAKITEAAGIEGKTFHCLRHSHATLLLNSGEPLIDVSRRLGHSKPSLTLDIYGHAIPGNDKQIAEKVENLIKFK